jgi:hypothetical protein
MRGWRKPLNAIFLSFAAHRLARGFFDFSHTFDGSPR